MKLETDYLVVGAGASGLSFVDTLVSENTEIEVTVVDRRHAAGGHWLDAYPFVRLHQPSAYYGVDSLPLGDDRVDTHGVNAGFYECATAPELIRYYEQVRYRLESTGRVRFLLGAEFVGSEGDEHVIRSRVTGRAARIVARRRFVDATYVESVVPARHTPPFPVDPDVRFVAPNGLIDLAQPAGGFVIVGAGKTAMDVGQWLLEQGVAPDTIAWIRPRDGWFVDRAYTQPFHLLADMVDFQARSLEAMAVVETGSEFAHRLEEFGMMCRLDESIEPDVFRGATVARAELESLRTIERIVRNGRVTRVGRAQIELEAGSISIGDDTVVVDCTAQGLATRPMVPIFGVEGITVQFTAPALATLSAAILGFVESLDVDDAERNRLCPVVPRTGLIADQLWVYHLGFVAEGARRGHPDIDRWLDGSRLNPLAAAAVRAPEPDLAPLLARVGESYEPAVRNLARFAR